MKTRYLGRTGVRVSELCLGTMTFGWRADEAESSKILDAFREEGGNFIDTADVYSQGRSEEIIGKWLDDNNREDFVVATKVRFPHSDGANSVGLTRKHILFSVEQSLRRLCTDYIDLLQIHSWDPATPIEETLRVLNRLVEDGKVLYIGASNLRAWQLQMAIDISRRNGWNEFVSLQPQYNLLCRATEFELLPVCRHNGLGVIVWSPLRGGLLGGGYRRGMKVPPEERRLGVSYREGRRDVWDRYNTDRSWDVVEAVEAIANRTGRTCSQVALNWVMNRDGVTAPIIGVSSEKQLRENVGAAGWKLDREAMEELNRISMPEVSYPYDAPAEQQQWRGREDWNEMRQ
ncbi:MAG: aldo/keto reductase [Thermoplasmata archaeon YP2-bin.285]|uniref:Aldo/keto reductase n=1 Tax=Candidatus Sysuiplasma superficiale TaxID=2823368 RepID=A0A8J7YNC5_9ARCH|nr:aldo/keto reductase [Candidatus Sysuiplasma superficiale]